MVTGRDAGSGTMPARTTREIAMTRGRNDREPEEPSSTARPEPDGERTDHPDDRKRDPGAYVGREPERQAATIPGGISPKDERIAAHSTQSGPAAEDPVVGGHREGGSAGDDDAREAGQSR
jgi:hypothetical protein